MNLDAFSDALKIAVFETNEEFRQMSVAALKDRLRDVVGIHTLTVGPASVTVNDTTIPVAPGASDDEIAAAVLSNIQKINAITGQQTPMSVTGLQSGAFQAKLADMRQKISDQQAAAIAKIDAAVNDGAAKMDAAASGVAAKAQAEIDSALQEFSTFTNGGPA